MCFRVVLRLLLYLRSIYRVETASAATPEGVALSTTGVTLPPLLALLCSWYSLTFR